MTASSFIIKQEQIKTKGGFPFLFHDQLDAQSLHTCSGHFPCNLNVQIADDILTHTLKYAENLSLWSAN